ncbi:MAG: GNAT family N-acetyltransferase [Candidatus Woesearchaeota archaeon]
MKYIYFKKKYLNSLNKLAKELQKEFIQQRTSNNNTPIDRYFKDSKAKLILAIDKSQVVGYRVYTILNDNRGRFMGIGVAKKYRRKRIATKLYNIAINDLKNKNVKEVITKTWSTNTRSIPLFEKMGFKKYKTIKNARIDGSDTIWFRRKI